MSLAEIRNYRRVSDRIITGGQPTAEQLVEVAREGYEVIINLAPCEPGRSLAGEAELVRSLGMEYVHIPIDWASPTAGDFAAFERALTTLGERRALIHCIANFRVTAFYAMYALKHLGWSVSEAETLHASMWQGNDHPVWERFWSETKAAIHES